MIPQSHNSERDRCLNEIKWASPIKSRYLIDKSLLQAGYDPVEIEAAWQLFTKPPPSAKDPYRGWLGHLVSLGWPFLVVGLIWLVAFPKSSDIYGFIEPLFIGSSVASLASFLLNIWNWSKLPLFFKVVLVLIISLLVADGFLWLLALYIDAAVSGPWN